MVRVVVDTNIIFSALINSQSSFAEILLRSEHEFFACETTLVEIFKHKEKIAKASRLPADNLIRFYNLLLRHITIYREALISPENRRSAFSLCQDVDETDTPHLALALELNALLWTGDKQLKAGLKRKGFSNIFTPE